MKTPLFIVAIVAFLSGCNSGPESQIPDSANSGIHKVIAEEIIQASEYTYLRVKEGDAEIWLAVSKVEAKAGETYYYKGGLPMTDFESRELSKTFKQILFLDSFGTSPDFVAKGIPHENPHSSDSTQGASKENNAKREVKIEKAKGGISIEELFLNKQAHAGKKIKIRGIVTKYNPGIMDRNWVHVQDGTEASGEYDLTITTLEEVSSGDTVTFEGVIVLGRDFGFGYSYAVIMEEAKLIK